MKGGYKSCRTQDDQPVNHTNFNDWSDPQLQILPRPTRVPRESVHVQHSFVLNEEPEYEDHQTVVESVESWTSQNISDLRSKIKKGYAPLSLKEIRNYRLPFYESLLLNLEEDCFEGTCSYIKDLIELDEKLHGATQSFTPEGSSQSLKSSKKTLLSLCDGLTKAEVARLEGDRSTEIRTLLELALPFSLVGTWMWLAEELFEQCVQSCDQNNNKLEAFVKYLFAKFLFESKQDTIRSKTLVEQSMKLSLGKNWNAAEVTGLKTDILYIESCLLLHKIYLMIAESMRIINVEEAIKLCRSALHWAKQVNCKPSETAALKQLTWIYLSAGKLNAVPDHLASYMRICEELGDVQGLCDGYIMYATYYDQEEQNESVIENITKLLNLAEEHKIQKMIALAHHKMATFYLKHNRVVDMEKHAAKAYSLYVELSGKGRETDETKCLTGIAQAQRIMTDYLNIILEADSLETSELQVLLLWKTLRLPFTSNTNLFQPESEVNRQLKDRIDLMKIEEVSRVNKTRQAGMAKNINTEKSRSTLKHLESTMSFSTMVSVRQQRNTFVSQSGLNF